MKIEDFFEQEKGITVDGARNAGARYTAIDICRFATAFNKQGTDSICIQAHEILLKAYSKLSNSKDEELLQEMRGVMEKLLCN